MFSMSIVLFVLILVGLIVAHELGHFAAAKLLGVKVEEFGIGFPPRVWGVRVGETIYSINALLLGGFVRMFGEYDPMSPRALPRSFASVSRLRQAVILIAGVAANFLCAWFILSAGFMIGLPSAPQEHLPVTEVETVIVSVMSDSPAARAGLVAGDVVEGAEVGSGAALGAGASSDETQRFIGKHQEESIVLHVRRDGEEKIMLATPAEGYVPGRKALGIELSDIGTLRLSLLPALYEGAVATYDMTLRTAVGIGSFFASLAVGTGSFSSVSGPIGITNIGATAVRDGLAATLALAALLSINLGLINLLPIPGLDGGRLLFTAIEAARRRPLPASMSHAVTLIGIGALLLLMLVVSYHDIVRLLG